MKRGVKEQTLAFIEESARLEMTGPRFDAIKNHINRSRSATHNVLHQLLEEHAIAHTPNGWIPADPKNLKG